MSDHAGPWGLLSLPSEFCCKFRNSWLPLPPSPPRWGWRLTFHGAFFPRLAEVEARIPETWQAFESHLSFHLTFHCGSCTCVMAPWWAWGNTEAEGMSCAPGGQWGTWPRAPLEPWTCLWGCLWGPAGRLPFRWDCLLRGLFRSLIELPWIWSKNDLPWPELDSIV